MVPVTAVSALQVVAHRVGTAGLEGGSWCGSALETGIAGVALARRSASYRPGAQEALDRLRRLWKSQQIRSTSADTAALALGARLAAELSQSDSELMEAARRATVRLTSRDQLQIPLLHLALIVWALGPLIADRSVEPWPGLRDRLHGSGATSGIDTSLREYAVAVSGAQVDANVLVRRLVQVIGDSLGPTEAAVTVWLLTAAFEILAPLLPPEDNALQLLLGKRQTATARLAAVVESPKADWVEDEDYQLTRVEAGLLDMALASPDEGSPWLSADEARALFGHREAAALASAERERARYLRLFTLVAGLIGVLSGLALWLGLAHAGVDIGVANAADASVTSFGLTVATVIGRRTLGNRRLIDSLGLFFSLLCVTTTLVAAARFFELSFLPGAGDLVVGGVVAALGGLFWALLSRGGSHAPKQTTEQT